MNRRVAIGLVLLLLLLAAWISTGDDGAPPALPDPDEATDPQAAPDTVPADDTGSTPESASASWGNSDPEESGKKATPDVPGFFEGLNGTVVDVVTARPIEGARVISVRIAGKASSSCGDDTDANGRFEFTEWTQRHREGAIRFVLQVSARGYEPLEMVPRRRVVKVELVPLDRPLLPGIIYGRAVDPDHRPLSGCIGFETKTDEGKYRYHTVLADGEGRFELPGVAPGARLVRVEYSSDRPEIWVPEGGTVNVEVVSTAPVPSSPAARTRIGVAKRIEELQRIEMTCAVHLSDGRRLTRAQLGHTRDKYRKAQVERRWLQLRFRDLLGARPLVVTGLPKDEFAVLRARFAPEYWCVAVTNGRARFPSLTPGSWKLILERPGKPDRRESVHLVEGKGPQTHRFGD